MTEIMEEIYALSILDIGFIVAVAVIGWGILGGILCCVCERGSIAWKKINLLLFATQLIVLIYLHLNGVHQENVTAKVTIVHTLLQAKEQPELYRVIIMKGLLYIPFGVTLSCALNTKKSIAKTVGIFGIVVFISSITLEVVQWLLKYGNFDIDSVLFGICGSCFGCISFISYRVFIEWKKNSIQKYIVTLYTKNRLFGLVLQGGLLLLYFIVLLIQFQSLVDSSTALDVFQNVWLVLLNISLMVAPVIVLCVFISNYICVLSGIAIFFFIWSILNYYVMLYAICGIQRPLMRC